MKTAAFSAAELRFGLDTPGPGFVGLLRERARRSPVRGFQRLRAPLGPPESRPRRWEFRTAKCESRLRRPDFATAKRESRLRRPDFFTAKRESRPRRSPLPGRGFFGRAAGRNGALPYIARKSRFLRNGDVWATESLFLFAVLWLAILPDPSETGIAGGEKPAAPNPGRPAAARPTTATGSRFLRRQRERPPQSACSRRLSGCPYDRTFPPSVAESPQNQHRRSAS